MEREILSYDEVVARVGDSITAFDKLVAQIRYHYELDEVYKAGNPKSKYHSDIYFKRSSKTLIGICLREGYFLAYVILGKDEREKFDAKRDSFCDIVKNEYDATEVYHDGKWMSWEIRDESLIDDLFKLVGLKSKPNRKVLPQSLSKCKGLGIGLAKADITKIITQEG